MTKVDEWGAARPTRRGVLAGAGGLAVAATVGAAAVPDTLSATEVVDHIRDGQLSAESCLEELLERCRRLGSLNALTWVAADRARSEAAGIDRRRREGATLPPLAGLPLVVKDNIDVAGMPTSAGTPGLRHFLPRTDAAVVERLRRDGAIIFAKANMHELAAGVTSSNRTFGAVANPFERHHIPGGSSGGSACAIAAGLAPAALGTDTGGSVRMPSAYCGTVGLRPSAFGARKAYPDDGVVPLCRALDTIGPMGRTVADVILLHQAITGRRVPRAVPLPAIRLGLPRQQWSDLDPQVAEAGGAVVRRLRKAGVVLVDVDLAEVVALSRRILETAMPSSRSDLHEFFRVQYPAIDVDAMLAAVAGPDVRALLARSHMVDGAALGELHGRAAAAYAAIFRQAGIGALLFPTTAVPAPPIAAGGDAPADSIELNGRSVDKVSTIARNTSIAPTLGAPGLSMPMGLDGHGVPLGIELDGLPGADEALLAVGLALEPLLPRLSA